MLIPPVVSPTGVDNVYRVSFSVSEDDKRRSQVVCFVYPKEDKMEIAYSHHTHFNRPNASGPWNEYSRIRLPITPMIEAHIRSNVGIAVMEFFMGRVRQISSELEQQVTNAETATN